MTPLANIAPHEYEVITAARVIIRRASAELGWRDGMDAYRAGMLRAVLDRADDGLFDALSTLKHFGDAPVDDDLLHLRRSPLVGRAEAEA